MVAIVPTSRAGAPPAYGWRQRRRYAWMADAAGVIALSTVLVVVAKWLADGGITAFAASGGVAVSLGRLTGLIAAALLLIQVLLMARIPIVERAWGQDVLTRRHRLVGETSFYLIVAHIVLITIGYTQAGTLTFWAQAWDFVVNYPGMLLAVAGTIALVVVVATSVRAARRRLRYESWHLLHLYAYIGVALVLPHELWTGADFRSSAIMTAFWWTAWALAAAALVTFRLVIPLARSVVHRLVVEEVRREAPGVQSVVIGGRNLARLRPLPGQYFQWRFLTGRGWTRAHPYSVSALPGRNRLRITMGTYGDEATRLRRLRPGTRVLLEGPYGSLTADRRWHRDVLLMAAGLGITPLRGLAEHIATERPTAGRGGSRRPSVLVMHRISAPGSALFTAEWNELAARYGIGVGRLVGPRGAEGSWLPASARPTNASRFLMDTVPDVRMRDVYLCGPRPWMDAVRRTLREVGVDERAIHHEGFER